MDQRLRTWTVRTDFSKDEKNLFILTWWLEVPGAFLRLPIVWAGIALLFLPLLLALWFIHQLTFVHFNVVNLYTIITFLSALVYSYSPLGLSLLTIWGFSLGEKNEDELNTRAMGAREPSNRELEKVIEAFTEIENRQKDSKQTFDTLLPPRYWHVLDRADLNAYMLGNSLFITTGLLNSDFLPAVIAHELGHLNSMDNRLMLAVARLATPQLYLNGDSPTMYISDDQSMPEKISTAFGNAWRNIANGGLAFSVLGNMWIWDWREREYYADNAAAQMGFASELIQYLELHKPFDFPVPFYLSTHPYTELRIDKLLAFIEKGSEVSEANINACEDMLERQYNFVHDYGLSDLDGDLVNKVLGAVGNSKTDLKRYQTIVNQFDLARHPLSSQVFYYKVEMAYKNALKKLKK